MDRERLEDSDSDSDSDSDPGHRPTAGCRKSSCAWAGGVCVRDDLAGVLGPGQRVGSCVPAVRVGPDRGLAGLHAVRLALAVTGIGAGMLLVAAGVRIVRRAMRRGAAAEPAP